MKFRWNKNKEEIEEIKDLLEDMVKEMKVVSLLCTNSFYESKMWREMRDNTFFQKGRKCFRCGKRATEIHHIHPISENPTMALDIDNLVPLCSDCHAEEHGMEVIDCPICGEPFKRKKTEYWKELCSDCYYDQK